MDLPYGPLLGEMRAAIGTAATPAEPINGLIFPLVITHISLPNSNPPMVLMQNASNPNPKIISVSICKKFISGSSGTDRNP